MISIKFWGTPQQLLRISTVAAAAAAKTMTTTRTT